MSVISSRTTLSVIGVLLMSVGAPRAADGPAKFETQEIRKDFGVGYAVSLADVNADRRPDIVAINGTQLVWFENPSWQMHVVLDGQTPKDNVTIAPHDIDGDGLMDVALGAAWNPRDTQGGGTLHWVNQQPGGKPWTLHDIGSEPTLHRIRWARLDEGKPALVVTPLHGRGTSPPNWEGQGARLLLFRIPARPASEPWPMEVVDDTLHIFHNFIAVDFDGTGGDELITASREGLQLFRRGADGKWSKTRIGDGAPGEVRMGRVGGRRMLATVEPWHGTSIAIYAEPESAPDRTLWKRTVIEDAIAGGHALGWADFDGDGDEELAAGWREGNFGVALYEVTRDGTLGSKSMIDSGGMATEDLAVGDLDGDGRPDIVASGRKTSNVRIYWNRR
ncbi:MAG TPA: VCBS repeat-containing protein [Vicinamibacterales bacterium]